MTPRGWHAGLCAATALLVAVTAAAQSPVVVQTLQVGDTQRRWLRYDPPASQAPRGIVVVLHGNGSSADEIMDIARPRATQQWLGIAAREGLRLLVPDGTPGPTGARGWNDCRGDAATNPAADDVAFFDALLRAERRGAWRRVPVYVVGFSNGGAMALRLAIERPRLLRAATIISAAMPAASECAAPRRAVDLLFINGTADRIVPFEGGMVRLGDVPRGSVLGTAESVAVWARLAGAGEPTVTERADLDADDNSRVTELRWAGPRAQLRLLRVTGGGHAEPTIAAPRVTWPGQNRDIEAAAEAWAFFRSLR